MTDANSNLDLQATIKELREIQSKFFDHATNYTKLVLSLGYGGFFAAWSITRQYLPPRRIVWSALCMTVSLLLFILFEVLQTWIISSLGLKFSGAKVDSDAAIIAAQKRFSQEYATRIKALGSIWIVLFPLTVFTGLAGAGRLVSGVVKAFRTSPSVLS